MKRPLLELRQATKTYGQGSGKVHALKDVCLSIAQGEFVALTGPSGSGKSTLLNMVGGLDTLTSGSMHFAEQSIGDLDAIGRSRYRHAFVGFVFQGFNLLRRTSALENVELPLFYRRVPKRARRDKTLAALDQVGLADRARHTPAELSGGQQQRIAIARAIVSEPTLLVADEPTGNLDSERTHEIMGLLAGLNRSRGMTLILVTHEPEVAEYANRMIEFRDGGVTIDRGKSQADAA